MRLSARRDLALNAICPYFTMFPLEYPLKILGRHRKRRPVVMDPFCGRGTTLFAARHLGLRTWGADTSAVAVAIAKAKLAQATFEEIIDLAANLAYGITPRAVPRASFFRSAFEPTTLARVCSIREGLLGMPSESDAVVLLRATMLGCLHGPRSKDPSHASYFSNQMPRTFAPKPGYAVRFWKSRGMEAPKVDVLFVLSKKLERICQAMRETDNTVSQVRHGDARLISTFPGLARRFSVVVTSPPYYGMKTYVPDQWLRNWFLGGPPVVEYSGHKQLSHFGQDSFASSLGKVWRNMARSEADSLDMYVRFGLLPSFKANAKELFLNSLEESCQKWKWVYTAGAATADAGMRQADQWVESTAVAEHDFHVRRAD